MGHVIGVDEVGRGPLAGPLTAAAVVLPQQHNIQYLADSKSLTSEKREIALHGVQKSALTIGVGWAGADYIDNNGLTRATQQAMLNALRQVRLPLGKVIVDGAFNYLSKWYESEAIIGADKTHEPVAAASIVAKEARDKFMRVMDSIYPHYGFQRHVGYGTAEHRQAIREHGPCGLHRLSFKPLNALTAKN